MMRKCGCRTAVSGINSSSGSGSGSNLQSTASNGNNMRRRQDFLAACSALHAMGFQPQDICHAVLRAKLDVSVAAQILSEGDGR
eukprot:m.167495 g.167495  ORF g.167495 m.167495 type:complete len:84 (+) comp17194_c2_seq2:345-596(+)